MKNFLGNIFDFNRDGKTDAFELALSLELILGDDADDADSCEDDEYDDF